MSIVIGFVAPEYIVMCADERVCRNGNIHSEDFRKVYYLNPNLIFGFAGNVVECYLILSDYLQDFNLYDDEKYKIDIEKTLYLSFTDVCDNVRKKIEEISKGYDRVVDISLMISGFVDGESRIKCFSMKADKLCEDEIGGEKGVLKHFVFGSKEEEKILINELNSMDRVNINNLQKVFQKTIKESSKTNETINDKMKSVFIEKPTDIK